MNKVFADTGRLRPKRSVFDLSHERKFTCDMGQLIPVLIEDMIPGDKFKIGAQTVIRMMPLVAPVLHEVNVYLHLFFVPYRILWTDWENYITGGVLGDQNPTLPTWNPTNTAIGSLWDYCGLPTGIVPTGALPMDFIRSSYARIYNEYYRDETLQTKVAETQEVILNRGWEKDRFTSAMPWQQRGTGPAIPIVGTSHAVWPNSDFVQTWSDAGSAPYQGFYNNSVDGKLHIGNGSASDDNAIAFFAHNNVDLGAASPFSLADFRLAFQIQHWMERNARGGVRYVEFLQSHHGVSPRDDRLQRPEYVGGMKAPLIISEVLQTSQTGTTPQGNLAGHGISVADAYCGDYFCQEYGLLMGIMSIMPKTAYQNGVDRQFIKQSRYDFVFPEFVNLSEQAILNAELCAKNADATYNTGVFGYQGRYDEYRTRSSQICGKMRDTFKYWHLSRIFDPASPPSLNDTFIKAVPRKDIFAAPTEVGLIVNHANIIKAIRPLPIIAEPGLIDHH